MSAALLAGSGAARAQDRAHDAEARSLFEAGKAAFADGRFEDALARFEQAYELSGRPELLYNVASSLDRLGRLEEAAERYERYLEEVPDATNRNYVERRLELIAEQTDEAAIEAQPDATQDVDAEQEPTEDAETPEAGEEGQPEDGPSVSNADVATPAAGSEPSGDGPSRIAPITLFAVGGGAALGALATGLMANTKYSDLEDTCTDGRCPEESRSDRDSLRTLTITTDVLIGVAAASAAAGVVLWVLGSGDAAEAEPRVRAGVGCSGEGCSVGATVPF